ncbi:MAG: hypothetical protein JRN28_00550 [Nitrososphaerota archaeon]|nr:hypothetical protein [Nitrososphaerota archaeon]
MKRHRLGQHYLVDESAVRRIVGCADIKPSDRVLEIGTGRGALTKELAVLGASFLGYEIDEANYEATIEAVKGTKARIVLADAFGQNPTFDVLVASLPYSESATFVRWLSTRQFSDAVAVLQKDFVQKISAAPGARNYRGISAVAQIALETEAIGEVRRASFDPPPKVDSVIVRFSPKRRISVDEVARVIHLFSLRRRQVDSALAELGFRNEEDHGKKRVASLTPDEVHLICERV